MMRGGPSSGPICPPRLTLTGMALLLVSAQAQVTGSAAPPTAAAMSKAVAPAATMPASTEWQHLQPSQRRALAPLAVAWPGMTEAQRRKWLALVQQFDQRPAAEQALLQSRMADWAALSPAERQLARINFGSAQTLPPDRRAAEWEAYRALPDEERQRLARSAPPPPRGATALQPVPAPRLARQTIPAEPPRRAGRISVDAARVDPATLLPTARPAGG